MHDLPAKGISIYGLGPLGPVISLLLSVCQYTTSSWFSSRVGIKQEVKRVETGTPRREPQEYSRHIFGTYLPGSINSYHIPTTFLRFPI